jgi:hypothetical protein
MIELQQYDEAEEILIRILQSDPENQFAKQEIAYIRQMAKQE